MTLTLHGPAAMAVGDAERLVHALRNLVENAIKFSPEGSEVVVTTWAAHGEVGVTVLDHGPGVAPDGRERIFDRFFRADPSRTRSTGGGGLGLAITREIASARAGRVWGRRRRRRARQRLLARPRRSLTHRSCNRSRLLRLRLLRSYSQ